MGSYLLLLIVPLICAPIQNLYLAFGQRYDLGSITYIATGTLLAAELTDPRARPEITFLTVLLVLLSAAAFLVRSFILTNGTPTDFTLFTFGQAWAVPALVQYEIERRSEGGGSGVYVHSLDHALMPILALSFGFAALATFFFVRSSTSLRLITFTESPFQYRLVSKNPWQLAWKVETTAIVIYFLAGISLRFVISDVSGQTFGLESIWCLLSAAVIGRRWQRWVIFGPIIVTMGRLTTNQYIDSKYSMLMVYALLAVCLIAINFFSKKASREISG